MAMGGIEMTTGFNALDATDPENFQIQVSGASLQTQLDTLDSTVTTLTSSNFVTTAALNNSLSYKQNNISTAYPLPQPHVQT